MEKETYFVYEYTVKASRRPEHCGLFFSRTWAEASAYAEKAAKDWPGNARLIGLRCIGEYCGAFSQI